MTNPRSERVRRVAALVRRSVRERTGRFLVEGPGPVREAVRHRPDWVHDVYLAAGARERCADIVADVERCAGRRPRLHAVTDEVLAAMADTTTPQGVLAVCRVPDTALDAALRQPPGLVCVLDEVRDPGNAGTVVRAADAAGADLVVVSARSVDVWSPKVVRSSAGSLFHLPVVTGAPTASVVRSLQEAGLAVLAADVRGERLLPDVALDRPHAWVLGNEAHGSDPQVRQACDEVVRVPLYGLAESLNLAMAATVCLYASAQARAHRAADRARGYPG